MSESLATYLNDHLAGATFAIELLESLRDQHTDAELGAFARALIVEIDEDKQALQAIVDRVGKSGLHLKEATAWLAEKVSQLKLRHDQPGGIGTFEALETLLLGILGKMALWRVLPVIAKFDTRVGGSDFGKLLVRAQEQYASVEQRRLLVARTAFAPELG